MGDDYDSETGELPRKPYLDVNGGYATWAEFLNKMEKRGLSPDGAQQIPDPTPMEPPIGYVKAPDLMESIRQMVKGELLRRAAEEEGFETEEEADDFSMEEEGESAWDTLTPYEQAELEGMSPRRHAEKNAAETMTAEPVEPPVGAPKAPEEPAGSSTAPSSASPLQTNPQGVKTHG